MKEKTAIEFEIVHHVKDLSSANEKGWKSELNIVKWGENKPKADVRSWNSDHTHCGKGITLTSDECDQLFDGLNVLEKYKF